MVRMNAPVIPPASQTGAWPNSWMLWKTQETPSPKNPIPASQPRHAARRGEQSVQVANNAAGASTASGHQPRGA
jgi:hypothetical protein